MAVGARGVGVVVVKDMGGGRGTASSKWGREEGKGGGGGVGRQGLERVLDGIVLHPISSRPCAATTCGFGHGSFSVKTVRSCRNPARRAGDTTDTQRRGYREQEDEDGVEKWGRGGVGGGELFCCLLRWNCPRKENSRKNHVTIRSVTVIMRLVCSRHRENEINELCVKTSRPTILGAWAGVGGEGPRVYYIYIYI